MSSSALRQRAARGSPWRSLTYALVLVALLGFLGLLGLAGCGVPASGTRTLDADEVPYRLLESAPAQHRPATPTGPPSINAARAYFLNQDDQLVAQTQPIIVGGAADEITALLATIAAGPDEQQRAAGLSSAAGPDVGLELVELTDGTARIQVTPTQTIPSADRIPLVVGQIVLSVTSVPGVDRVALLQDGQPLEAPLPGGARTSEPVGAMDYQDLLAPPSPSPRPTTP